MQLDKKVPLISCWPPSSELMNTIYLFKKAGLHKKRSVIYISIPGKMLISKTNTRIWRNFCHNCPAYQFRAHTITSLLLVLHADVRTERCIILWMPSFSGDWRIFWVRPRVAAQNQLNSATCQHHANSGRKHCAFIYFLATCPLLPQLGVNQQDSHKSLLFSAAMLKFSTLAESKKYSLTRGHNFQDPH